MLITLDKIEREVKQSPQQESLNIKLWVYPFLETLTEEDQQKITQRLNTFMEGWQSHKEDLHGNFFFEYNRFLILFAKINGEVSGCAIDASANVVKNIQKKIWKEVANKSMLFFQKKDGEIVFYPRYEIQKQIDNKNISLEDNFFDNGISTMQQYLNDEWKMKVANSWLVDEFEW